MASNTLNSTEISEKQENEVGSTVSTEILKCLNKWINI